ncbi:amidohydrolase family protein [Prolixibacteraceae bacterium]|nr:amidohydrolase family protein [Prolixibacteraceae bacterium]
MRTLGELMMMLFFASLLMGGNSYGVKKSGGEKVTIIIKDINLFDGSSGKIRNNIDVLIVGNRIAKIGKNLKVQEGITIEGKGKYMTPGLIDNHWHSQLPLNLMELINCPAQYLTSIATWECGQMLMRGVTTIRDAGGNCAGLKRAIDEGYVTGPRIYPSQALIGQYSGHVDFRNVNFFQRSGVGRYHL